MNFQKNHLFENFLETPKETSKLLEAFEYAIFKENLNLVEKWGQQILAEVGHFETKNKKDKTPLLVACTNPGSKSASVIDYLLKNGANPNTSDQHGWTPFHWVLNSKSGELVHKCEIISLLIKHGGQLSQKNNDGYLPQHFLFLGRQEYAEDFKMLQFLIN